MRKRRELIDYFKTTFGPNSERLFDALADLALGKAQMELRKPRPEMDGLFEEIEIIKPSWRERLDAMELLLSYTEGKPAQSVEVEHTVEAKKWNPDLLSLEEIETLERLAKKGEAIDAIDVQLLPEGVTKQ